MTSLKRNGYLFSSLIMVCSILPVQLSAYTVFESASAPASQFPAVVVSNDAFAQQASGVLFQITQTTLVDSIGVWIYHNNNTSPVGLFGEIFSAPDLTSFPSTDPYSSSGLGRAYFGASSSGQPSDLIAPLPLALTPGYYSLIIGNLPSSEWGVPINGVDSSGISANNFIEYLGGTSFPNPPYPKWQQGSDGMRFFITEATPVPEPATGLPVLALLLALTTLPLYRIGRKSRVREWLRSEADLSVY